MNHRFLMKRAALMKRVALLLFAGLFGFATLQTATAQENESTHEVTIDVEEIQKLTIVNDVSSVTVSELNRSGSTIKNSDFADNGDGAGTTTTFQVRTNLTGLQVDAQINDGGADHLGLQVSLTGEIDGEQGYQTLMKPDDDSYEAKIVADDIGQTISDGELTYRAVATPEFNPTSSATVEVLYTLTE